MKYMGGKQQLLRAGLGMTLLDGCRGRRRVVDLMSGSGAVTHFMATRSSLPVWANDLQAYSSVVALGVIGRKGTVATDYLRWIAKEATESALKHCSWGETPVDSEKVVRDARELCAENSRSRGFFWNHYGGHYFSPKQAAVFDEIFTLLPENGPERLVAHAGLVQAASHCAAAPGHTAQPFQPTPRLIPYIREAWARDPAAAFVMFGERLGGMDSTKTGVATTRDALSVLDTVDESDLVFVDAPYSGAQYSRFYHVLEAVAVGGFPNVEGAGRMPQADYRSKSGFSQVSRSDEAMTALLRGLAERRPVVVMTFPDAECSNGLSGRRVTEIARRWFSVSIASVPAVHSTLGGPSERRGARRYISEFILTLKPKRRPLKKRLVR